MLVVVVSTPARPALDAASEIVAAVLADGEGDERTARDMVAQIIEARERAAAALVWAHANDDEHDREHCLACRGELALAGKAMQFHDVPADADRRAERDGGTP